MGISVSRYLEETDKSYLEYCLHEFGIFNIFKIGILDVGVLKSPFSDEGYCTFCCVWPLRTFFSLVVDTCQYVRGVEVIISINTRPRVDQRPLLRRRRFLSNFTHLGDNACFEESSN